ncbi:glycosyltransferase [Pseudoclavibacter sp. CFCC 13611]|uniref:glycosyltransferase n=1 Tax=Pseudoclavibacter sp. CFCC 13611 TaxID=2615178 RepID=UPI0013012D4B|nr:glycosyltransferase [Pseudoclavibacter sp. CFCC 13611]KAB1663007.1 glycosyltransferase [Pseudoclavibacter sp. CFCC 13611]
MNHGQVTAIIPTFHPGAGLLECVSSLDENGIRDIVIIDDGSDLDRSNATLRFLDEGIEAADLKIRLIRKQQNLGIANSLNIGVNQARESGLAQAILTIDQDSRLPRGYVSSALQQLEQAHDEGIKVGLLAPSSIAGRNVKRDLNNAQTHWDHLFDPIQSGAVIPLETLDAVGLFDEDLVIDGVDTDFNYRCLEQGRSLLAVDGTNLSHAIGEPTPLELFGRPVRVFGRQITVARHNPLRMYYISRNSILIARAHRRHLGWRRVLRRQLMDVPSVILSVTVDKNRTANRQAVRAALQDARRGFKGQRPAGSVR